VINGRQITRETGHYLLTLGLICWANGQFAASSVFRHGRPVGPIIVLGTILVANMSATLRLQLSMLVLFTAAAMFLLIRLHALDEQATWRRRRIGDPSTVGSLYIRGGTIFVVAAIAGSLALTVSAHSAPLAGVWDDAKPMLIDISQWLQRFIPVTPQGRGIGVPAFGQQVTIGGIWTPNSTLALTIQRPRGDNSTYYWRTVTYDTFTLNGWGPSGTATANRDASAELLPGTADATPKDALRKQVTFTISPVDYPYKTVFSPIDPDTISRPTTLHLTGSVGSVQYVEIAGKEPYEVTASVPVTDDKPGGATQNRLRVAGTAYPIEISRRYTEVPQGAFGPEAQNLLNDLIARAKANSRDTPFDFATLIVDELHNSSKYHYETNVLGLCDKESSIVECFAKHRQGYCEYYASTMVMLLRGHGIPARLVEGFLPGSVDPVTFTEQVTGASAHAWVEVYFPGYGWQLFDPTGGGVSRAPVLPIGSVIPTPSRPATSTAPGASRGDQPNVPVRPNEGTNPGNRTSTGSGIGPFILVGAMLVVVAGLLVFLAWRRGPRSASNADGVYASIVGLARRFGVGPRPTQTAYEYAAALGDIQPNVRPELHTVAAAKVEVAYGNRTLGEDRLRALRESYRRLRVSLLRLAFRRRDRRRMRGR
jgi:hypothetical protein